MLSRFTPQNGVMAHATLPSLYSTFCPTPLWFTLFINRRSAEGASGLLFWNLRRWFSHWLL
jgi:hypothetical protein